MNSHSFLMKQMEKALGELPDRLGVPGFSVAAVGEDRLFLVKGFGLADIKQGIPATPDTVYMWFSLTKIATATAIMQLVDQGKLNLDDKVREYIPNFPTTKNFEQPKIRHLLNHSSGLSNPLPIRWVHLESKHGPDPNEFFNQLMSKHGRLRSIPGEKASYSNLGYLALGIITTVTSGMPYKDYVLTKILKPIGMQQTDFCYTDTMIRKAAIGYQKRRSPMSLILPLMGLPKGVVGGKVGNYIAFNRFYLDGAAYGGLIGPIEDAARFVQVHINGGYADDARIISQESVTKMQQISSRGDRLDVGFGWFRSQSNSNAIPYLQQIGGGAGFLNVMRIYPQEHYGIIVMGNSTVYNFEGIIESVRSTID